MWNWQSYRKSRIFAAIMVLELVKLWRYVFRLLSVSRKYIDRLILGCVEPIVIFFDYVVLGKFSADLLLIWRVELSPGPCD